MNQRVTYWIVLKNVYGYSNIKKQEKKKKSHSGWYYIPMELLNLFIFHMF